VQRIRQKQDYGHNQDAKKQYMKKIIIFIFLSVCSVNLEVFAVSYHNQALSILNKNGLQQANKALRLLDISIKNKNSFIKSSLFASGICILCFEQLPEKDLKWLNKGLKYINLLLDREPENVDALVKKAQILMDKQSYNQGALFLRKALRIDPNHIEATLIYLGYLLERKGVKQALQFANKVEDSFKDSPIVMKAFALIFLKEKKWDEALNFYMKSMDTGLVNDLDTMIGLGKCYFGLRRIKDSIHVFENTYKLYPNHHEILIDLANAHTKLKQWEMASSLLEKYLQFNKNDKTIIRKLIRYYKKSNQPAKAALTKERLKRLKKDK